MAGGDMSIGELAARFALATHVLRHWEEVGLLAPRRDSAGRRRYHHDDAETVAMILLGKQAGLSLEELAALFTEASDQAARRDLLRAHRDRLVRRIAAATAALDTVSHALNCAVEDFRECPHFQAEVAEALALVTNRSRPRG
ncbi:MerR family transcriptional regulator [Nocardia arthritidis]|uniref:MerR family transcriptional regulator n=1 Tax=Nocardia arthritidis TaxID=228602 RepID=UPI0007A420DA|nr:MerR family transcriptional regulator [Nocardia arthritidis]